MKFYLAYITKNMTQMGMTIGYLFYFFGYPLLVYRFDRHINGIRAGFIFYFKTWEGFRYCFVSPI